MTSDKRKTALIVENDLNIAEFYQIFLKDKGWDAYIAKINKINSYNEKYDFIIIDGLNGKCFDIYENLNSKRKVICTGSLNIFEEAKEKNIETFLKPTYIGEILKGKDI